MNVGHLRCEDEAIQFCGKVQEFGFLLVANSEQQIIAASENCVKWLRVPYDELLGLPLADLVKHHLPMVESAIHNHSSALASQTVNERRVSELILGDSPFYLSMYAYEQHIYLEFERKLPNQVPSFTSLYTYAQKLENTDHIWQALCQCISDIIGFDRVMTYKFKEDNSGQVVAETVKPNLESYMGLHYPEFDIPQQARALYLKHLSRLTSDIHGPTFSVHGVHVAPIDLSLSAVRALSPVHLQYLENAGAQASISFSIIVHGKLWGLITCQHESARLVDLSQRHLCVLLTQYAVNRYLSLQKEIDLHFGKQIKEFELALKEKLLLKSDILSALSSFAPQVCDFAKSDGFAIVHKDATFVFGVAPPIAAVRSIHSFINQQDKKPLYKSDDFVLRHGTELQLGTVDFAGLVKMDVDSSRTFSLFLFKREQVIERLWAGKPEKIITYDQQLQAFVPSPRNSFDAWKQLVRGVAPAWQQSDIYIMKRIRKLIRESLLRKSEEIQSLNQELILLNNALDTYSYTVSHDLKNPLSVIKLSVQMLQSKRAVPPELLSKLIANMKDASELMESMLNKIYEFSKVKEFRYEPALIHTDQMIAQIVAHCKTLYVAQHCEVTLGTLHPIFGEKTLIYQLFSNVISNSIKYSSKQTSAKVSIHSSADTRRIRYTIEDNGIGISSTELNSIFEIFKRMSNSSGYEGSGVGLAIVKRIVDRIGVTIDVESEMGRGTRFHLDFPN